MSARELPDFLKSGDAALGFPHRKGFRHVIGSGFPEMGANAEVASDDPASAKERAARKWLGHLMAGRIGRELKAP